MRKTVWAALLLVVFGASTAGAQGQGQERSQAARGGPNVDLGTDVNAAA